MQFARAIVGIFLVMGVDNAATAGEGAFEINQACALDGGCFQGDAGGFPVELSRPGIYRLTSDLDLSEASQPTDSNAIFIQADDVTLELGGHLIAGVNKCQGQPVTSCDNTGTADGIAAVLGVTNTTIRNGAVTGMTNLGISLPGEGAKIFNVEVRTNGGGGIGVGDDSKLQSVAAIRNGGKGIVSLNRTSVFRSRASFNATHGFELGGGSIVSDSVAAQNGETGIRSVGLVKDCISRLNQLHGIALLDDGSVIDSVVQNNQEDGINCHEEGAVKGNMIEGNFDQIGANCVEIGTNYCDEDTAC